MSDPAEDRERAFLDELVVDRLSEHGDEGSKERRVDHWAYFAAREQADAFRAWAERRGYEIERVDGVNAPPLRWGVRLHHLCRPTTEAMSAATRALSRAARALGGEYDGWETTVERDNEASPVTSH